MFFELKLTLKAVWSMEATRITMPGNSLEGLKNTSSPKGENDNNDNTFHKLPVQGNICGEANQNQNI